MVRAGHGRHPQYLHRAQGSPLSPSLLSRYWDCLRPRLRGRKLISAVLLVTTGVFMWTQYSLGGPKERSIFSFVNLSNGHRRFAFYHKRPDDTHSRGPSEDTRTHDEPLKPSSSSRSSSAWLSHGSAASLRGAHTPKPTHSPPMMEPVADRVYKQEWKDALLQYQGPPDFTKALLHPPIKKQKVVLPESRDGAFMWDVPTAMTFDEILRLDVSDDKKGKYAADFREIFRYLPPEYHKRTFIARFGDNTGLWPLPFLTKARAVGDLNASVLPMNVFRHFGEPFQEVAGKEGGKLSFQKKGVRVVWRGVPTDSGWNPAVVNHTNQRRALVERWGLSSDDRIDVGFNELVQEARRLYEPHYKKYVKPEVSVAKQLNYRYLISAEGNDVATGLKWMLASNSVVLMPPPRRESWALEGHLQPWVHYVPLREDYADLWDRVMLCEKNLRWCAAIAQKAREYVSWFRDTDRSYRLAAERIREFIDNVEVEIVTETAVA